jgi:hypothetical protein
MRNVFAVVLALMMFIFSTVAIQAQPIPVTERPYEFGDSVEAVADINPELPTDTEDFQPCWPNYGPYCGGFLTVQCYQDCYQQCGWFSCTYWCGAPYPAYCNTTPYIRWNR